MNNKELGKRDAREDGYPVYMDSEYCEQFLKIHDNCDLCEYSFACDNVLLMIIRRSVEQIRDELKSNEEVIGKINSEECKTFRVINENCKDCLNNDECYIEAIKILSERKVNE
jgi:hypothetical protein